MLLDHLFKIKRLFLVEVIVTIIVVMFFYIISIQKILTLHYNVFLAFFGSALGWLLFSRYGNYIHYFFQTKEGVKVTGTEKTKIIQKARIYKFLKPIIGDYSGSLLLGLTVGSTSYVLCSFHFDFWAVWTLLAWLVYLIVFSQLFSAQIYLQSDKYLSSQPKLFHRVTQTGIGDVLLPELVFKLLVQAFIYYEIAVKTVLDFTADTLFWDLLVTLFIIELVTGFFIVLDIKRNADIALSARAAFNGMNPDVANKNPGFSEDKLTRKEFFGYFGWVMVLPLILFSLFFFMGAPFKLLHYLILCMVCNLITFGFFRYRYLKSKWTLVQQIFVSKPT